MLDDHLCDADERQRDSLEVGGLDAAKPLELLVDAGVRDDLGGELHVERGKPKCPVRDDLYGRAALAKEDHRAELHIVGHTGEELVGTGAVHHGLDAEALDPGLRPRRADALDHR